MLMVKRHFVALPYSFWGKPCWQSLYFTTLVLDTVTNIWTLCHLSFFWIFCLFSVSWCDGTPLELIYVVTWSWVTLYIVYHWYHQCVTSIVVDCVLCFTIFSIHCTIFSFMLQRWLILLLYCKTLIVVGILRLSVATHGTSVDQLLHE